MRDTTDSRTLPLPLGFVPQPVPLFFFMFVSPSGNWRRRCVREDYEIAPLWGACKTNGERLA